MRQVAAWAENKLGKFKGFCRGADVSRKGDAISSDGDARAVGIALLWADHRVLYGLSSGFVKDRKGPLLYKGRGIGASGGGVG